ncbi:MAG: hypothetical protein U0232_17005 [Thermomicrobiales bacterium]
MQFKLIEPLRFLFKDEVRAVGRALGLPSEIVDRQPFPGPGLAVRLLGAVEAESLALLRRADAIVRAEIEAAGLGLAVWQFFAVLLPVRTVGVMGDLRTYGQVCAIRAVTSEDAMTADWARLPHEVLARISNRIVNEVHGLTGWSTISRRSRRDDRVGVSCVKEEPQRPALAEGDPGRREGRLRGLGFGGFLCLHCDSHTTRAGQ